MNAPLPPGIHSDVPIRTVYVSGKPVKKVKTPGKTVSKALQSCNSALQANAVGVRARAGYKEALRLMCPHCKEPSFVRTSSRMTVLTRESTHVCTNPECGHTFVALTMVVRTLSPSATPDPSVNLPLSTHVRRDMIRAILEHAASAAHDTQCPPVADHFAPVGGPPPD